MDVRLSSTIIKEQHNVTAEKVAISKEVLKQTGETGAADVVAVAEIIHQASQLQNISKEMVTDVLEIIDTVSELNQSVLQQSNSEDNITNGLIMALEQLADRVSLEGGEVRLKTNSTVMQVWNLSSAASQSPVLGLQMALDGDTRNITSSVLNSSESHAYRNIDTAISMPQEFIREIVRNNSGHTVRLSVNVFTQTGLFQTHEPSNTADSTEALEAGSTEQDTGDNRPTDGAILNSKVIAMRLTVNGQPVTDLSTYSFGEVTTIFRLLKKPREGEEVAVHCVFWDLGVRQGQGGWSREGCRQGDVVSVNIVKCICDHLTHFAVLMDMYGQEVRMSRMHQDILTIITTVGLTFSIGGLSITVLAFLLVKKLRQSVSQQVLFNIALSMLLSWVTFLAGIRSVKSHMTCVAVAMLLHYFILVSFLWMLAQGVLQYVMLVNLRRGPVIRYMLKAGLPAWGLPLLLVAIMSAVDVELYRGGDSYCWMSLEAFYYAFLAPIAIIVVINTVIYVMVVASICRRPNMGTGGSNYTALNIRASISCFVVLGLSWIFAFFALGDARLVFRYLFVVTATPQGFLIFALYTARDPEVQAFCLKQFRMGVYTLTTRAQKGSKSTRETSF